MSVDHLPYNQEPRPPVQLNDDERKMIEDHRRAIAAAENLPQETETNVYDPNKKNRGFKTWHKLAAGALTLVAAATAGVVAGNKALNGHDKVPAKRPAATAPANPGAAPVHETSPTANPETEAKNKLPVDFSIDIGGNGTIETYKTTDELVKALEIPANASPVEAMNTLVSRMNLALNWASDPTLTEKYKDYNMDKVINDPTYEGYGGIAAVRNDVLFPALEKALGGKPAGDADGLQPSADWISNLEKLSETVGGYNGSSVAHGSASPYHLTVSIDRSVSGLGEEQEKGIAVYPQLEGRNLVHGSLIYKDNFRTSGLEGLPTTSGGTRESLAKKTILHALFEDEDGAIKPGSMLEEDRAAA